REDRRQAVRIADGAERGDRRLAHEWIAMVTPELGQSLDDVRPGAVAGAFASAVVFAALFARGEGGHLHDGRIGVVERLEERDIGVTSGELSGPAADAGGRITKR